MEKKWIKKGFGGAVLMDLSKAFDTINHELLIAKLHAYGFDLKSLRLLQSYLFGRDHSLINARENFHNNGRSFQTLPGAL